MLCSDVAGVELPANVVRSTVSPDFARLGAEHSKQHCWLLGGRDVDRVIRRYIFNGCSFNNLRNRQLLHT